MRVVFVPLPEEIQQHFEQAGFTYLAPEVLALTYGKADIAELSGRELQQIRYWKSYTLGEIIFNGYD
jgi:hypothetical protein